MELWVKPNWHVAMVHLPLGLLTAGVLWELLGVFFRSSLSARGAGRWMVLLGAVFAVPTAMSGLYAYADLFPGGLAGIENADLKETLADHVLWQSVATGAALLLVAIWIGLSDRWRGVLHWPWVALLALTLICTLVAAHHGGKLVYEHHVGTKSFVGNTTEKAPAATPPEVPERSAEAPSFSPAAIAERTAGHAPPVQTHVVIAGFALALAAITLGLAARAVVQTDELDILAEEASARRIAAAFSASPTPYPLDSYGRPLPERRVDVPAPLVRVGVMPPAARFWLLTALCLIVSALTGWWTLVHDDLYTWKPAVFWQAITDPYQNEGRVVTRLYAHLIAGGSLIVLTLILALLARFGRRQKFMLTLFGLLLVLAMAAQLWLGVVLLLEGSVGPVTKWNAG